MPAKKGVSLIELKGRVKPWRVTYWESDLRKTAHFKKRGEAKAFAREQGIEEELGDLKITGEERMAIVRIRNAAQAAEVPLQQLVDVALSEATRKRVSQRSVQEAADAFLKDGQARNLRSSTLSHYAGMLRRFCRGRESRNVESITRAELMEWILGTYANEDSRDTARTPLMAWLRWCGRQGFVDPDRWRDPLRWQESLSDDRAIGILRPAQLRLLLRRLPQQHRFPVALCCFTGIRPKGELDRLRWEHIDERRRVIELPGSVSKIRRGRTLHDLPPVVWEWIAWERRRLKRDAHGRILRSTYRNFREAVRKAMNGQRAAPSKHGRPARQEIPSLGNWPRDATRHSFGSYGYHVLGIEQTVELMGHIGGYKMFASRYKASSRAWTARLWFTIRP